MGVFKCLLNPLIHDCTNQVVDVTCVFK